MYHSTICFFILSFVCSFEHRVSLTQAHCRSVCITSVVFGLSHLPRIVGLGDYGGDENSSDIVGAVCTHNRHRIAYEICRLFVYIFVYIVDPHTQRESERKRERERKL